MPIITDRDPVYVEHPQGGEGRLLRDSLLSPERLGGEVSLVAQISLEPGNTLGVHRHTDDNELYFITEGTGTYTDNSEEYPVKAGDALFCEDGDTHGIANTGEGMLRFVAVIQKTA